MLAWSRRRVTESRIGLKQRQRGRIVSTGLPDRFILLSGGVIAQAFLNIPFTTTLLSQGAAFTFLLWYLMPRDIFKLDPKDPAS
ncbi:hypothetical protein [Bradyrhizobium sp. BR13661]|uniref:hypothetical protein n=1 Tax=Bradyrhizobium sp. BR13661 TaxID=2940622 RepID=UPI0024766796|nr:hypothetical protein [Bradyrhizobium sp. BR13661]MDH6261639.1 hypothetical protein [Bradyrhizobium sp. BR13661]